MWGRMCFHIERLKLSFDGGWGWGCGDWERDWDQRLAGRAPPGCLQGPDKAGWGPSSGSLDEASMRSPRLEGKMVPLSAGSAASGRWHGGNWRSGAFLSPRSFHPLPAVPG